MTIQALRLFRLDCAGDGNPFGWPENMMRTDAIDCNSRRNMI